MFFNWRNKLLFNCVIGLMMANLHVFSPMPAHLVYRHCTYPSDFIKENIIIIHIYKPMRMFLLSFCISYDCKPTQIPFLKTIFLFKSSAKSHCQCEA